MSAIFEILMIKIWSDSSTLCFIIWCENAIIIDVLVVIMENYINKSLQQFLIVDGDAQAHPMKDG